MTLLLYRLSIITLWPLWWQLVQPQPTAINVGLIGNAISLQRQEDKVLEITHSALIAEGVLDNNLQIKYDLCSRKIAYQFSRLITSDGCINYDGVTAAAQMYYTEGVSAIIGPYCDTGRC